jgi:hypothetical protein
LLDPGKETFVAADDGLVVGSLAHARAHGYRGIRFNQDLTWRCGVTADR